MKYDVVNKEIINLVGITTRTSNLHIFESDPTLNPIALTVQKYFHQRLAEKIPHRKKPGTTYCVYTNYESDHNGNYTYFIGEEVDQLSNIENGYATLIIPPQYYCKFTNDAGPMPDVCVAMWKRIWEMTPNELGGERSYISDFEIYDERSQNHSEVILDLYIGIKK